MIRLYCFTLAIIIFANPALARAAPVVTMHAQKLLTAVDSEELAAGQSQPSQSDEFTFGSAPLSEIALQAQVGREDIAMTAQSNSNAAVVNNSLGNNSITGEIKIDDQAFQNLSGLSLLNINTGNNVAINASMNVNISITSGP